MAKTNALMETSYQLEGGQVLTADTVKNYLVSGNGAVTDQEVMMFIELCKAQRLNPFIREAYLIKFGNSPANIVVGKDVFVKRAYRNPSYRGMKAGIVVVNTDGKIEEREGSIKLKGEQLIGGWCEVYVEGQEFPIKSSVSMEEYSKGQSTWKQMPCVMIRKCAMVTALREAFPEDFQGLYDSAEMNEIPDRLPEKEVVPGMASPAQKKGIMKLASMCDLYDINDIKNTAKLEEFCESNGYNLHELTFEEAKEVADLLGKYCDKVRNMQEDTIVDAEYTEVEEEIKEEDAEVEEGEQEQMKL